MKRISWIIAGILASTGAQAAQIGQGGTASLSLGGWNGLFKQSAGSYSTSLDSGLSLGFAVGLGLDLGNVRLEYTPHFYFAYVGTKTSQTGRANDFSNWSLLAGNLAFDIPGLPISPYVGAGLSDTVFSFGSNASLDGYFWRIGCDLALSQNGKSTVGLRAEYQQHTFPDSASGTLPGGTSTKLRNLFVGLVLRGGGEPGDKK
ncbi:MAG: hypothetical protein JNL01_08990 [Bdellovibrionales bacterium]|nr:hypothetical protein [Bdellovibrionales bacterium]